MSMSGSPCVSVIVPVYNSAAFLRQALDSVVSQSYREIELIVIDDGSTDESVKIARSYPAAKIYEQNHQGACRARNLGLRKANGEYIKFLDSDDIFEPSIIEKQAEFMSNNMDNIIVYGDIIHFNDIAGKKRKDIVKISSDKSQELQLLRRNIQTSAPLYRRSDLIRLNGFDDRLLRAQEFNLHLRLSLSGLRFVRLPGISTHVRKHEAPHRITNQKESAVTNENAELRNRLYLEMFRERYGRAIPSEITRHFVRGAVESALVKLRSGDWRGARRAVRRALQFEPGIDDIIAGAAIALGQVGKNQWRNLVGVKRSSH